MLTFENRIPVKIDRLDFKDIDSEKIRDFLKPDRGCEEGKYYKMVLTEQSLLDSERKRM